MMNQQDELVLVKEQKNNANAFAAIIVFIWMLLGALAFITSIVCFAYDGSFMQNWVGFLTAIVTGPFFWIFYAYSPTYCTSGANGRVQLQKKVRQIVKKSMGGKKK